jgi:hypothetical protein
MARCRCGCGKEFDAVLALVRGGRINSCGCKFRTSRQRVDASAEAGKRYGSLTVVGVAPGETGHRAKMVCRCDCGKTKEVELKNLKTGNTRSCGCQQQAGRIRQAHVATDKKMAALVGRRFGRLKIEGLAARSEGKPMLRCRCDCGEERDVNYHTLIYGGIASCGCARFHRMVRLPGGKEVPAQPEAEARGVSRGTLGARLRQGWTIEDAVFTPLGAWWRHGRRKGRKSPA